MPDSLEVPGDVRVVPFYSSVVVVGVRVTWRRLQVERKGDFDTKL